jgi:type VI secretion system protein ImpG
MFSQYYQDELNYLRGLGEEYARRYPQNAKFLGTGAQDPDVERLLQGFAFLTARLHEKFDDQYSQVAEGYLSVLWPEILKPIPSITMVQFNPDPKLVRTDAYLPAGQTLHSRRYNWGRYTFQSSRSVHLYPFQLIDSELDYHNESWILRFEFKLNPGASLQESNLTSLPIYISGTDLRFRYGWHLWFSQYIKGARFVSTTSHKSSDVTFSPVGFQSEEGLFPKGDAEMPGHRILRDFLTYPKGFLFSKVDDISCLKQLDITDGFNLEIDFGSHAPSQPMRETTDDSFKLYCTPAVNLFETSSRILFDHSRSEYLVRSDEIDIEHHEVYSISDVTGIETGTNGSRIPYQPFYSKRLSALEETTHYPVYRERYADIHVKQGNKILKGRECFLSIGDISDSDRSTAIQTFLLHIICTQRGGASDINPGELCEPGGRVPAFVSFKNLDQPTRQFPAPPSDRNLWLLISTLVMSRQSMVNTEVLKSAVKLYGGLVAGTAEQVEYWLSALKKITVTPGIKLFKGTPLRVLETELLIDCEQDRVHENHLFAAILCEFLRNMATVNTRLNFSIKFENQPGLQYSWPVRTGTCLTL